MIELLVRLFYSEDWEQFSKQRGNRMIHENLLNSRKCMTEHFWTKLTDGWFHDAYLMKLHCDDANSLRLYIRKQGETISMCFTSVSLLECKGALLDHKASFPCARFDPGKPMAQILDIWVELVDEITLLILLDNGRYIQIRCDANQLLSYSND